MSPRKRRKRYTDTEAFGRMMERMLHAYGLRVGAADMPDLQQLLALQEVLDDITADAILALRATGYSWADIAETMGVTRQAAQQKWGPRARRQSRSNVKNPLTLVRAQ